jgi:hypothetical protein
MKEKQYKEYLALAKQYQKPYHEQHHKEHHKQTLGKEYSNKVQEIPLIAEEIDAFFWGKLVQLGWRIDSTPLETLNSTAKITRFIYVCPDCDMPLHFEGSLQITPTKAKKMCDVSLLQEKLVRHQTIAKDCKAIPEEEAE